MDRQQRTSGSLAHLDCRSDDQEIPHFHSSIRDVLLPVVFCDKQTIKPKGDRQDAKRQALGTMATLWSVGPPAVALDCCCCCCCCCGSKTSRKSRERRGGDNVSHSPRLNSRMRCPQHNPRLTSKKFRNKLFTLACPRPPRLRAFVRTNLSNKNKGQHGGANKCAQDGYPRLVEPVSVKIFLIIKTIPSFL